MNVKRFLLTSLVVFLASTLLDWLVHGVLMAPLYAPLNGKIFRSEADMQSMMWVMWVVGIIWSVLFVYIFTRGYQGRGVMEGVRYGLLIGLFTSVPMAYGSYFMYPVPYALAIRWLLYGTAQQIVLGALTSAVYRPAAAPQTPKASAARA